MRQLLENWATYNSNIWYTADYPNFRIWLTSSGARCRSSRSFRPTAIHVDRSCRKPFFNGDKSYNQTLTRLKTREMEQRTPTTLIHTVAANCEIFFLHQFFPLKVDSYQTKNASCCRRLLRCREMEYIEQASQNTFYPFQNKHQNHWASIESQDVVCFEKIKTQGR